jgi:enoyl-[acyl-carrier protein] reductase II
MRVVFEERIEIFVAGLAVPDDFIAEMHEHGMKVVVMCGKVRHAIKSEQAGADVVAAQGTEAGGHTGEIGTLALVPQVVDAVKIPVLAAGGIADGRGVAAALALGAQGAVIGTRFIASNESTAAPAYRKALVVGAEDSTVRTRCYTGKPARAIRNSYTSEWEAHGRRHPTVSDSGDGVRAARRDGLRRAARRRRSGSHLHAGRPRLGLIHDVRPAAEVFRQLVDETIRAITRLKPLA